MKAWLKFVLKTHKYVLIMMCIFVYCVLLPYTLQMISLDNELEIERIFSEVKYWLAIIEVIYLYIILRYILSGECLEVIFSIYHVHKYKFIVILMGIFLIVYSPLFLYYYNITSCLYDILDVIFLLMIIAHLFYVMTFVSKSLIVSFFSMFIYIVICNQYNSDALWNVFHPMIRSIYIKHSFYIVYIGFVFICVVIGMKLEDRYIE